MSAVAPVVPSAIVVDVPESSEAEACDSWAAAARLGDGRDLALLRGDLVGLRFELRDEVDGLVALVDEHLGDHGDVGRRDLAVGHEGLHERLGLVAVALHEPRDDHAVDAQDRADEGHDRQVDAVVDHADAQHVVQAGAVVRAGELRGEVAAQRLAQALDGAVALDEGLELGLLQDVVVERALDLVGQRDDVARVGQLLEVALVEQHEAQEGVPALLADGDGGAGGVDADRLGGRRRSGGAGGGGAGEHGAPPPVGGSGLPVGAGPGPRGDLVPGACLALPPVVGRRGGGLEP
jgi:hypothetical protein